MRSRERSVPVAHEAHRRFERSSTQIDGSQIRVQKIDQRAHVHEIERATTACKPRECHAPLVCIVEARTEARCDHGVDELEAATETEDLGAPERMVDRDVIRSVKEDVFHSARHRER